MKKRFISIIIPIFEVEQYIRECIDSIIIQDIGFKEHIEIICVNDCSPENENEIIKEYINKYPENIIMIEHETNKGIGEARNTGIKYATGTYIHFIDSDDFIYQGLYSQALKTINQYDCDIFTFGFEFSNRKGKIFPSHLRTGLLNSKEKAYLVGFAYAWLRIFHHSLLEKALPFPTGTFEDIPVIPFISYYAKKEYFFDHPFYLYRQRENSVVFNSKKNKEITNDVYWAFYKTYTSLIKLPQRELDKESCLIKLVCNYIRKDTTEKKYKQIRLRLLEFQSLKKDYRLKKIQLSSSDKKYLHPLLRWFDSVVLFFFNIQFYFPLILMKKGIILLRKMLSLTK